MAAMTIEQFEQYYAAKKLDYNMESYFVDALKYGKDMIVVVIRDPSEFEVKLYPVKRDYYTLSKAFEKDIRKIINDYEYNDNNVKTMLESKNLLLEDYDKEMLNMVFEIWFETDFNDNRCLNCVN